MASEDPWMTPAQVATELGMHASTVRLWISTGRLAAVRAGERKWRIRRSEVDRMLRAGFASVRVDVAGANLFAPPTLRPGGRVFDPRGERR